MQVGGLDGRLRVLENKVVVGLPSMESGIRQLLGARSEKRKSLTKRKFSEGMSSKRVTLLGADAEEKNENCEV